MHCDLKMHLNRFPLRRLRQGVYECKWGTGSIWVPSGSSATGISISFLQFVYSLALRAFWRILRCCRTYCFELLLCVFIQRKKINFRVFNQSFLRNGQLLSFVHSKMTLAIRISDDLQSTSTFFVMKVKLKTKLAKYTLFWACTGTLTQDLSNGSVTICTNSSH